MKTYVVSNDGSKNMFLLRNKANYALSLLSFLTWGTVSVLVPNPGATKINFLISY